MDLEVVGRHALLFDDDSMAAFVNSPEALIEWNSLSIDRYDVRHLLPGLPPLRRRRHQDSPLHVDSLESELDIERYLDLPSPSEEQKDTGADNEDTNHYNAVGFSYGDGGDSAEATSAWLDGSGFQPPFPVPDSVRQSIPPTEKVHQIIARTATFVSEYGGQSEIVLRVKQGNNPAFGFLMPDHHLHAYFRFLVDHQELLKSNADGNSQDVKKTDDNHNPAVMGRTGALSLLGSIYGSGEDEDSAAEHAAVPLPTGNESLEPSEISNSREVTQMDLKGSSVKVAGDLPKELDRHKEKAFAGKRSGSLGTVKARTSNSTKKVTEASGSHLVCPEKSQSPVVSDSKQDSPILDPPPELKRVVDKIVEFILRNGKEFEAVLLGQDSKHGKFPFLAQSNKYHPYYLRALQRAQESKSALKSGFAEKGDSTGPINTKVALSSGNDATALEFSELPYTDDRKEKFKMVLGKSKKDGSDQRSKDAGPHSGVSVDATAAAAILQAARRGMKLPNLDFLSKASVGDTYHGDGKQALGDGTSQQTIAQKQSPNEVGEANSSEPYMTDEQRLKADRLRRAKMFVARLKSGSGPLNIGTSHGVSEERPESAASGLVPEVGNHVGKDSEHSSASQKVEASHEIENSDMKCFDGEYKERRSKRSYRERSKRNSNDNENDNGGDDEENDKEEKDLEKPKKKHRSRRSSHHHSKERHRQKKRHSSSKDRESRGRHKRRHDSSSDEELYHQHSSSKDRESRHGHKHGHDSSSDEEHYHQHPSSKDGESQRRHKRRHDSSSDEEHYQHHRGRSCKHRSPEAREGDLEEGEISTRLSKASKARTRETLVDLSNLCQDGRASSQPPESTTEVSDDLRAKIRAMLLATL